MKSLLFLCLIVPIGFISCKKEKVSPVIENPNYEVKYLELGKVNLTFKNVDFRSANYVVDWGDGIKSTLTKNEITHQYPYNSFFDLDVSVKYKHDSTIKVNSPQLMNVLTCKTKIAIITKKLSSDDFIVLSLGGLDKSIENSIGALAINYQREKLPYWDMKPDKDVLILELGTRKNYQIYSQKMGELETKLEKRIYTQDNLSFQTIEL